MQLRLKGGVEMFDEQKKCPADSSRNIQELLTVNQNLPRVSTKHYRHTGQDYRVSKQDFDKIRY